MYHEKCNSDEVFIGNTPVNNLENKKRELESVKSLRVGTIAYDIHGEILDKDSYKSLFINKRDSVKYDSIMMSKMSTRK